MNKAFNASAEIADSANYPGLRFITYVCFTSSTRICAVFAFRIPSLCTIVFLFFLNLFHSWMILAAKGRAPSASSRRYRAPSTSTDWPALAFTCKAQ